MLTDLHEAHFPEVYARFTELLQGKPWLKATEKLRPHLKANPLSLARIQNEYGVAYGLTHFDRDGMSLADSKVWPTVQQAMSYAAQVCGLVENAKDEKGKKAYLGRISGSFSNPEEMRAIRFEHLTVMVLHHRGAHIEWPDECSGPERFDLLVSAEDILTFEVECKSCSSDKGRPITTKDASELLNRLTKDLLADVSSRDILVLKVRVPKRLPTAHKDLDSLAAEVAAAFREGKDSTEVGVLLAHANLAAPAAPVPPEEMMHVIYGAASHVFGEPEGHRAIVYNEKKSLSLCIEVCSGRSAQFFNAVWETAKHAVQDQMTKLRPGCLVLRLEGISKDELQHLAGETPNSLAWFATKVLGDVRHEHLACLAYVSDEEMVSLNSGSETAQTSTYVFESPVGKYSKSGIGQFFMGSPRI